MPSKRILIIEDDAGIIELLEAVLESGDYEPVAGRGGRDGLRKLRESQIDLVLLDLMMDDVDGWAVLDAIKADPELRDTPVIIVSVRSPLEDLDRASEYEGLYVDYVIKPFGVSQLLARIHAALEGESPPARSRAITTEW
ncbi:MAG: response regulator [Anaerolineae bacterium]|jgi:DNA-binding response OmpR family regulator